MVSLPPAAPALPGATRTAHPRLRASPGTARSDQGPALGTSTDASAPQRKGHCMGDLFHPPSIRKECKMSTPTGDNAFLHELEVTVSAELTLAETSLPEEQADGVLRSLLGAVEALEDASGPGGHPSPAEMAEGIITAGHLPGEPGPGISRASAQQA